MSEVRCIYCLRRRATDADYEQNMALPTDCEDAEAERLGLNKLCWEEAGDDCTAHALEIGRPTSLADALAALDSADQETDVGVGADERSETEAGPGSAELPVSPAPISADSSAQTSGPGDWEELAREGGIADD